MKKIIYLFCFLISAQYLQAQSPFITNDLYKSNFTFLKTEELKDIPVVEHNPEFEYGFDSLKAFLDSTKLTENAKNYMAVINVYFVVKTDGTISEVRLSNSSFPAEVVKELLTRIDAMKSWKPAVWRGQKVNCLHFLSFKLSNGKALLRYIYS